MNGEQLRARHSERLKVLLPAYIERIDWPRSRLAEERLRALRELLTVATTRSPWHRERLANIDIGKLSLRHVENLPVMTKTDLMDNFDDIVTDRRLTREVCERHLDHDDGLGYIRDEYNVVASGGSSGKRGVFVYGWDAWAICYASIVRFQQREWASDPALAGVDVVTAVVAASRSTHISAAMGRTFSTPASPRHLFPVTQPLEQIVIGLNQAQPTVLMGYSSFLPHLATEALAGRLRIAPRRVIAISEPLLPETRAALWDAWHVPIANGYGMSEGIFAGSCGHGVHLPDDLSLFEPVDRDGDPAGIGESSHHVYITNLYNLALPLIRFEVTDEITQLDTTCPCGSAFRVISDPQGRLDDVFTYNGRLSIHPHVFRSALGSRQITEYQVRQTIAGADISVLVQGRIDADSLRRKLEAALTELGMPEPHVTVSTVSTLDRNAMGKLQRFVPLARSRGPEE